MAKFQFRLATLLRLREATRDERRVQLAEVQRADAELQSQLERLAREQEQLRRDCREAAGPGTVDLRRLVEAEQYASALRMQEAGIRRQRETLAVEIECRRQAVIEADRDVQSLEKLRDNQLQAHRQEEDRQEGKRLDEAALQVVAT